MLPVLGKALLGLVHANRAVRATQLSSWKAGVHLVHEGGAFTEKDRRRRAQSRRNSVRVNQKRCRAVVDHGADEHNRGVAVLVGDKRPEGHEVANLEAGGLHEIAPARNRAADAIVVRQPKNNAWDGFGRSGLQRAQETRLIAVGKNQRQRATVLLEPGKADLSAPFAEGTALNLYSLGDGAGPFVVENVVVERGRFDNHRGVVIRRSDLAFSLKCRPFLVVGGKHGRDITKSAVVLRAATGDVAATRRAVPFGRHPVFDLEDDRPQQIVARNQLDVERRFVKQNLVQIMHRCPRNAPSATAQIKVKSFNLFEDNPFAQTESPDALHCHGDELAHRLRQTEGGCRCGNEPRAEQEVP